MGVIIGGVFGFMVGLLWLNAPNICAIAGVGLGYLMHAKLYNISRAVKRIVSALHIESRSLQDDPKRSKKGQEDDGVINKPEQREVSGFFVTQDNHPEGGSITSRPSMTGDPVSSSKRTKEPGSGARWFL